MTGWIALLRAVNVGGTGKIAMQDLRDLAADAGLASPRTYIASGNLLFESDLEEPVLKALLEGRLERLSGKRIGVLVRSAGEMAEVAAANPFANMPGNRVVAIFLDGPPPADALELVRGKRDERLALGRREIYVHYGDGMADSRLVIPAAAAGTARNINTVQKLASLASA